MDHVLDIVLNSRLYCERWDRLNDPMEALYSISLTNALDKREMKMRIEKDLNTWRIAALAKSNKNLLLWSHYADGHKGVAIEIDFPRDKPPARVKYDWATTSFTDLKSTEIQMSYLLEFKRPEWEYEEEYRIITKKEYHDLRNPIVEDPIKRILIGARADQRQVDILCKVLKGKAKLVRMVLDQYGGMQVSRDDCSP